MTHYTTTITLGGQTFTLEVWHDQDGETVVGVYAGGECVLDVLYLEDTSWQEALAKAICLHHHHLVTG